MAMTVGAATTDRMTNTSTTGLVNLSTLSGLGWVYLPSLTANHVMLSFQSASGGWRFELNGTIGNVDFFSLGATGHSFTSSSTPLATLSTWLCIGFASVFGTSCHIYVGDAVNPMTEVTYSLQQLGVTRTADTGGEVNLGNRQPHDRAFAGDMAPWGIWNIALSQAQMDAWRLAPGTIVGANCKALWYPGMEPATATVKDLSGNANHLTVTGATVATQQDPVVPTNLGPQGLLANSLSRM